MTESLPIVLHLPDPVGWIALTAEELRAAQQKARALIGTEVDGAPKSAPVVPGNWVGAEEAARALGVDASWLMRQARLRRVNGFKKMGKYVRFDLEALRAQFAKSPLK